MTRWVFQNKLRPQERERITRACAFLPTKELALTTGLPEVAITQAVFDIATDRYIGRDYLDVYPRGYLMPGESWAGPNLALKYAKRYIEEGLSYCEPANRDLRIDCLKSAELLLMHSAFYSEWEGSGESWRLLGEMYLKDWGFGNYWLFDDEYEVLSSYPRLLKVDSREDRAYYCLVRAKNLGDIESCVLLGQCMQLGVGCELDTTSAFNLYAEVLNHVRNASVRTVGLAALYSGNCFEYGCGCDLSFESAHDYYQKAVDAMTLALDLGDDLLEPYLVDAEKGLERMKQELGIVPFGFRHGFRKRRYCD